MPPTVCGLTRTITFDDRESVICDIIVTDDEGERVADILGFRVDRAAQKDEDAEALDNSFYQFEWSSSRPVPGSRTEGKPGFAEPNQIAEQGERGHRGTLRAPRSRDLSWQLRGGGG